MRRRLQQPVYYSEDVFSTGIAVEPAFAENFWLRKSLQPAETRTVALDYQGTQYKVRMTRDEDGLRYYIDYSQNNSLIAKIREKLSSVPKEGAKMFLIKRKSENLLELLDAA
jgi:hypothetical protein